MGPEENAVPPSLFDAQPQIKGSQQFGMLTPKLQNSKGESQHHGPQKVRPRMEPLHISPTRRIIIRGRGRAPRNGSGNNSRSGSKSPQKYSRNNSQNREVLKKSKENAEAVSSITVDTIGSTGDDIMDEADMFLDTEGSTLEYVAGADYDDFASSSIGVVIIDQY